ncbi:uncharacterized protein VTP21DRAFT_7145 [Calcarisporiella thermophila]|uniref:uncharacterized protein n=1 Tax=Calcarisporiella thermophila TaxID=911321 RepID=UPI0037428265
MTPSDEVQANAVPVGFTQAHLDYLNQQLSQLPAEKILEWAMISLPNLYQTTAFGLTGLVILDMISKISVERALQEGDAQPKHLVPLIFLDTLYHFTETVELADRVSKHYNAPLHIYRPQDCQTTQDFEQVHGERLWETDEATYDYLVKVEPARRAYTELNVAAVITGRRRSQKGDRENIPILEVEKSTGLLKLNPLASWDFARVRAYIQANEVPYNPLLDRGYRSIGDWHSTRPTTDPSNERSGRWQGREKTECGLHKDYFAMRQAYIASQKRRKEALARQQAKEAPIAGVSA